MRLLEKCRNVRSSAAVSRSIATCLLLSCVAVPGVHAYSVQPALIPDYPSETSTRSLENLSTQLRVKEEVIEMDGAVHLPLVRSVRPKSSVGLGSGRDAERKRGNEESELVALRDVQDITYNLLVKIGDITTPLVLDTGSSDMWALTDASQPPACKKSFGRSYSSQTEDHHSHSDSPSTALSFYPISALLHTRVRGLIARLVYGDSMTGTRAEGVVARDRVGVLDAGVDMENQFFAAIDYTNTSVLETGSVGIFGLGFPISSMLWNELYSAQLAGYTYHPSSATSHVRSTVSPTYKRSHQAASATSRRLPQVPGSQSSYDQGSQDEDSEGDEQGGSGQDYAEETDTRTIEFGTRPPMAMESNEAGVKGKNPMPSVLDSFEEFGPLIARLVMRSAGSGPCYMAKMASPQISISLQRTVFGSDGADEARGTLTIGGSPPSAPGSISSGGRTKASRRQKNSSSPGLTWAPVRLYTPAQGGAMLLEAPEEVYPYAWEAMMGDVWFNGVKLEGSRFGVKDVGTSALIDTGNSLIRGPADVISTILASIGNATVNGGTLAYPCADAQVLSFEFGGKRFDVDPRDFGSPIYAQVTEEGKVLWCTPNLAPTDAPELGAYLYSWSLGDPFLKGVLSSLYYGNITHPSTNPPRIGFASKVPSNAADLLHAEVALASKSSPFATSPQNPAPMTGSNMANGESTPKPIPENLFGQRLQPNANAGELSRRRPPWIGSEAGLGAGSRANVRLVGVIGSGIFFLVWVFVFRLVG